jgi:hypothetical protein
MLPTLSPKLTRREKKNMLGSPKRKKQHKISPKYNGSIIKYKTSREHKKKEILSNEK